MSVSLLHSYELIILLLVLNQEIKDKEPNPKARWALDHVNPHDFDKIHLRAYKEENYQEGFRKISPRYLVFVNVKKDSLKYDYCEIQAVMSADQRLVKKNGLLTMNKI